MAVQKNVSDPKVSNDTTLLSLEANSHSTQKIITEVYTKHEELCDLL